MKLTTVTTLTLSSSVLAADFFCEPNTIGGCCILFTDFDNVGLGWDCVDATPVAFTNSAGDTEWSCSSGKPGCCASTIIIDKRAATPPNPWQCDQPINPTATSTTPPPTTSISSTSTLSPTTTITTIVQRV